MKTETRKVLKELIEGIPVEKRKLEPDLNHCTEFKLLIKVAKCLVDIDDSFDACEIRSICEDVGGEEYNSLINDPNFIDGFANIIFSEIDNAKTIINVYKEILAEES
ncbi:MAG: hypothetical protein GZ094_21225 [Mariniphaga sp.]|nr:hypothetical protein [Mariniphaga sp.]